MCDTCGCSSDGNEITIRKPEELIKDNKTEDAITNGNEKSDSHHHSHHHHTHHDHTHDHPHDHTHSHHEHSHTDSKTITIQKNILSNNDLLAERNRGYLEAKNVFALNLVSSPGSGKTSLLEKTILKLKNEISFSVIEGDQQTMNDAERIHSTGAPVVQINTGNGCHLDGEMINNAFKKLDIKNDSVLFIENVGNLVCPALFDLGEKKRVVVISVTEGEDKPLKYPTMFESSDLCIINKIDLLPYLDFEIDKVKEYAKRINHHLEFIELSVKNGEGMELWYEWIKQNKAN